jgi:hypothetical protein
MATQNPPSDFTGAVDPNTGLAPGWTVGPDGEFHFSPTPEQRAGIKMANGDTVQYGADGQTYVDQAPHGIMDHIAEYAPYGIMATMGYGVLNDIGMIPAALGGSGGGAAGAGVPSMPWTIPAGFEASMGAAPPAAAAAGLLPATLSSPAGMVPGGVPATVATATGTGGGGLWDKLKGLVPDSLRPLAGAAGDAINSATQAAANNRGVELEANIARAQLDQQAERDTNSANMARSADDRAGQKSAWEMLNHAAYVANAPANLNTTNLSPYSKPVEGPGADARAGATALAGQTRDDLMSGRFRTNGGAPLPMPQKVGTGLTMPEAGMGEQIGNWAGPALTAWDRLDRIRRQTAPAQTPLPTVDPARPAVMPRTPGDPGYYAGT